MKNDAAIVILLGESFGGTIDAATGNSSTVFFKKGKNFLIRKRTTSWNVIDSPEIFPDNSSSSRI